MVKRGAALYTHLAIMCVYLYVYLCMMHILVFFYFLCSPLEKMISTTAIGGHGTLVKRETGSGLCSAHVSTRGAVHVFTNVHLNVYGDIMLMFVFQTRPRGYWRLDIVHLCGVVSSSCCLGRRVTTAVIFVPLQKDNCLKSLSDHKIEKPLQISLMLLLKKRWINKYPELLSCVCCRSISPAYI